MYAYYFRPLPSPRRGVTNNWHDMKKKNPLLAERLADINEP
jgi:hypothetical protein